MSLESKRLLSRRIFLTGVAAHTFIELPKTRRAHAQTPETPTTAPLKEQLTSPESDPVGVLPLFLTGIGTLALTLSILGYLDGRSPRNNRQISLDDQE